MVLLNIFCCAAFVYFAYLNLNDPDAWLWVSIYLLAGFFCIATIFGFLPPVLFLIAVALYFIYAVMLFFTEDGVWDWIVKYKMLNIAAEMQAQNPWIEQTREFFGLFIVISVLLIDYLLWL